MYRLYRCFGDDGALLYIGITSSTKTRMRLHARYTPWWSEVAEVTYESIPGGYEYRTANAVERAAIQAEHPRYNIAHRVAS